MLGGSTGTGNPISIAYSDNYREIAISIELIKTMASVAGRLKECAVVSC